MIIGNADFFISSRESEEATAAELNDSDCQWTSASDELKITLGQW